MTRNRVAHRYAQALYGEAGGDPRIAADLEKVRATLTQSPELASCLQSPLVDRVRKEKIVSTLFSLGMQPLTKNFLMLLVHRGRIGMLGAMLQAYDSCCDAATGVVAAQVRSGMHLPESTHADLTAALEQRAKCRVRLSVEHDSSLLAGLVVRIGDMVYDGSIRHQLARLHSRLTGNIVQRAPHS